MDSAFARYSDDDVAALIEQNPLAWLGSSENALSMTPLPMLVERDPTGRLTTLIGHMARSNPLFAVLQEDPSCHFLFMGPQGYIGPSLVSDPGWAPTWNYAAARITADVRFDAAYTDTAVQKLVGKMEATRHDPWAVSSMGERYDRMLSAIIGFRAEIREIRATFKLGQDERAEVFREIVNGPLDPRLVDLMQQFRGRASK